MSSIADQIRPLTPEELGHAQRLQEYLAIHALAAKEQPGMAFMQEPTIRNLLDRQPPRIRDLVLARKGATTDYYATGGRDMPFERRQESPPPRDVRDEAEAILHRKMDAEDITGRILERMHTPRAVLDEPNPERSVRDALTIAANAAPTED